MINWLRTAIIVVVIIYALATVTAICATLFHIEDMIEGFINSVTINARIIRTGNREEEEHADPGN